MPGIVGLITKIPRERAEAQLTQMLKQLQHEPSYRAGTLIDEASGTYVGWTAREGSFADGMPVCNERGNRLLIFSGEDFPAPGTVSQLKQVGHTFRGDSPEYLVHLWEEDSRFPASLNGRFHGIAIDRDGGTALLFNDRWGMHRIFYHESEEAFYFAAESKAILAVRPGLRKLALPSLGEYVTCGCVLENRTLFQGIQVLPPASAWIFRNGSPAQRQPYFKPEEWENQEILPLQTYYQELRDVFSKNLPRYFAGRERIGVSLTGGLDTRMIMAWHKSPSGSLPCYSFGGPFRDCQDVIMARKVASACGQPHEVIPVGREFLSAFAHYAERTVYLTDGCIDVTHSPDLYVNQRAAKIAPVRMTGNYGGEVLRRVRAFRPQRQLSSAFGTDLHPYVAAARSTYAGLIQGHPLSFAVFRQAPWHHYGLLSLEQTQVALRSPFLDNEFVQTVFRAPASALTTDDICLRLIYDGDPALMRIRTDRGLIGNRSRFTSAVARAMLEFTFKAEWAYDYGMPQWVARVDHLFSRLHLERLFLGRHKFYHFRVWYRDSLAGYVRDMLLDSRSLSRPYIDRKMVETIVKHHLKGDQNHTTAIHQLLTLELLHRMFVD